MTETSNEIAVATRLPGRVISGGQTGADQAGLIVARRFGLPTGGWMPHGWKTATGPNPQLGQEFGLREHAGDYAARTAANVRDSDGTIRLAASFQTLGERCTAKWIKHYQTTTRKRAKNSVILGVAQRLARQPPKRSTPLKGRQNKPLEMTRFLWEF